MLVHCVKYSFDVLKSHQIFGTFSDFIFFKVNESQKVILKIRFLAVLTSFLALNFDSFISSNVCFHSQIPVILYNFSYLISHNFEHNDTFEDFYFLSKKNLEFYKWFNA